MASEKQVREYLAYWFQLGKRVFIRNGQEALLPQPVIQGEKYSQEFERCWQRILLPESGDCYLEGTHETIASLLTPVWEMMPCGRCSMPIPIPNVGMPAENCPCQNLEGWPNTELPAPRAPVDSKAQLSQIQARLLKTTGQSI